MADTASIDVRDLVSGAALSAGTIGGAGFPLRTNLTHVLGSDVESAFTNYPNPFAAGRESTRITYYLKGTSRVTLKLFTLWGAPVITLIDNATMSPGLHQTTAWNGRNGEGDVVANGVYYLVLEINGGGGDRTLRRKVGVLR